jgi:hypothetical protein
MVGKPKPRVPWARPATAMIATRGKHHRQMKQGVKI